VRVKIGDDIVQGTVRVDENGTMTRFHSNKNNHKEKLEEFIKRIEYFVEEDFY